MTDKGAHFFRCDFQVHTPVTETGPAVNEFRMLTAAPTQSPSSRPAARAVYWEEEGLFE